MPEQSTSQGLTAALGVRRLIFDGSLRPGDRLSEARLAAKIGVSRTPLRLAFSQLEHDGLIEQTATGGFVVRSITLQEVADAIQLRGVLEGAAARLAAERHRSRRELSGLVGYIAQLDRLFSSGLSQGDDFNYYVEFNEEFHRELFRVARNEPLLKAYENALALPFTAPSAFVMLQADFPESERTLLLAQHHHHAILDAIEQREGARAEALAREHALLAHTNLDFIVDNETALKKLPGGSLVDLRQVADAS